MDKQSYRTKYDKRVISLSSERDRQTIIAAVTNAPMDEIKPLRVTIEETPKVRGLDQNALYWKRLGEIAEQAWLNNRQFDADTWHYYLGREVMPETITTKDGVECSKWVDAPKGDLRIISTTQLEKGCFAAYTTACEAFGSDLGVRFSTNREF